MNKPMILWGGTDVDSALYNKPRSKYAQKPDTIRDTKEKYFYELAVGKGQPVIGVCRGAQLICVLNGGELYQHTEPHKQRHSILTLDGILFDRVDAGHHQIMKPKGNFIVYGWNPSDVNVWENDDAPIPIKNTAEVVWFPKTQSLAVQPHPEWANLDDPFVAWLNDLIKRLGIDYSF